ncbi:N-acetylmuramoyl-L-alanine amidase [Thalassospira sp. MA62]|nr:N-acetylmuramoyl-L-alanine amidase [Thalassospira sp. MA62]
MPKAKADVTDAPDVIACPSPNVGPRPDGVKPDFLILHYTGMQTGQAALDRLCDRESSVSSHYLIEEDGRIFQLVDEEKRAWHAGLGCWQGCKDMNSRSIGIEIVNPGHEFGYRPFPQIQINSVIALCQAILTRHNIRPDRVIGHSDMAPDRKEDPGELFPWEELARHGIGLWPDNVTVLATDTPDDDIFDDLLEQIGYGTAPCIEMPVETYKQKRRIAFQRHWTPHTITGAITPHGMAVARSLAKFIQNQ